MKLNGTPIDTLKSLQKMRTFDFYAFWQKREEFLEMVCPRGKFDEWFWGHSNAVLGRVVCDWLNPDQDAITFKYFMDHGNLCHWKGSQPFCKEKEIVAVLDDGEISSLKESSWTKKYERLCRALNRKHAIGLVALYKLLGIRHPMDETYCQAVISGESHAEKGDVIYCFANTDFPSSAQDNTAPLHARIIANVSLQDVKVSVGRNTSMTLKPGECVTGVFQDTRCVELLPRKGSNNDKALTLLFDRTQNIPVLQITDKNDENGRKTIGDVISFYIDPVRGFAYVTREGQLIVPSKERMQLPALSKHAYECGIIAAREYETPDGYLECKIIYSGKITNKLRKQYENNEPKTDRSLARRGIGRENTSHLPDDCMGTGFFV